MRLIIKNIFIKTSTFLKLDTKIAEMNTLNAIQKIRLIIILCYAFVMVQCSTSSIQSGCNSLNSIDIGFNSCLIYENKPFLIELTNEIEDKVRTALILINKKMPIDDLTILIRSSGGNVIPEIGIGGFNPNKHEIIISVNTSFPHIRKSIEEELISQIAHEAHHAKRRRSVGYGNSLLEALISEGLADHFSIEAWEQDIPLWSSVLDPQALSEWINISKEFWYDQDYNHNNWFFGEDPGIPRWAGYSIGFELVKRYLDKNPSATAATIFNLEASAFIE